MIFYYLKNLVLYTLLPDKAVVSQQLVVGSLPQVYTETHFNVSAGMLKLVKAKGRMRIKK